MTTSLAPEAAKSIDQLVTCEVAAGLTPVDEMAPAPGFTCRWRGADESDHHRPVSKEST